MTEIKLYDSLTKDIKALVPLKDNHVNMYCCGMTVYNDCHIGHARVMVTFDYVRRWLEHTGYSVNYCRNITDLDDKIINKSNDLGVPYQELTSRYIDSMHDDEKELKCLPPTLEPKVTDNIDAMQNMVHTLITKNHAYHKNDGIYFRLSSAKHLGQLSNRTSYTDEDDFVLWKTVVKTNFPTWKTSFLPVGAPSWNCECAALSTTYLGDTLDIHGGGADLLFPHHENEILQAEALTGKTFANNWMHVGFITVKNESNPTDEPDKMSKSTGNFFTIKDVLKNYKGEVIRYFILNSHYRKQLEYSEHALKLAQSSLYKFYKTLARLDLTGKCSDISNENSEFTKAMNNDFNTPEALAVVHGIINRINFLVDNGVYDSANSLGKFLVRMVEPLGILQDNPSEFLFSFNYKDEKSDEEIGNLIDERNKFKMNKEYDKADAIRQQITFQYNVILEDTKDGTIYHRIQSRY